MGPWTHGARSVSYAGDVEQGPTAAVDDNLAVDYTHAQSNSLGLHRCLDRRAGDQQQEQYTQELTLPGAEGFPAASCCNVFVIDQRYPIC